jgi:hypothetical protein
LFHGETVSDLNEDATGTAVVSVDVKSEGNRYPAQVQHLLVVYCGAIVLVKQRASGSQEMRTGDQAGAGAFGRRLGGDRFIVFVCKDQINTSPPRPERCNICRHRLQQVLNLRSKVHLRQLPYDRLLAPEIHRRQEHGQLPNIILRRSFLQTDRQSENSHQL